MQERGIFITWSFWKDKKTTLSEKALLLEIQNLSELEKGCIAQNEHFSKLMGIKKEAVSRLISSLESKGYINSKIEAGSRNYSRVITINKLLSNEDLLLTNCLETKENKTNTASKETLPAFESLWKDYTLTFLKSQNRLGGTKKKALSKYKQLINKGIKENDIYSFVENHASLKFGHKDLERLLTFDLYSQYKEDNK